MTWLSRLLLKWRDRHNPAPPRDKHGYRYTYSGFDQSKAVQAAQRAKDLSERNRQLHVKRAEGDKARIRKQADQRGEPSNVVPMRRVQ